ncbi:M48 family metallopeptidase, partial [bacterium]|nr:M48 family metallopeptidase [bacterium]
LGTPSFVAENFIRQKKDWITMHLKKLEQQNAMAASMGPLTEDDIIQIKKMAAKVIPERVEFYSKRAGICYKRIFIRLQKTRWGSCSADGNLNFNCLLVLMPQEVLDSVVVHELCHRRHMNHSREFYDEVLRIFPDYRRWDKWLKQNGGAYFKRVVKKLWQKEKSSLELESMRGSGGVDKLSTFWRQLI